MKEILAYRVEFDEDYGHIDVLSYGIIEVYIEDEEDFDEEDFDEDYYENDRKYLRSLEEAKQFVLEMINERLDRYKKGLEIASGINKEDMIDGRISSGRLKSKNI
jgi:hypothetical protein